MVLFGLLCLLLVGSTALAQETATLPALADLSTGEWNEILPGGETTCAYGDPYRFYVRPADEPSDNLLVFFQGGGACWNAENCAPDYAGPDGSPIFKNTVAEGESNFYDQGIFDFDNAENPVADYNVVYVPYCTADVHTGSTTQEYESGGTTYTLNHKGAVNAAAALDWTYANYDAPSNVAISGCSAGAYGSIYHAPSIMTQYEGVPAVQMGDAGVGVAVPGWEGLQSWNFYDNLGESVPAFADISPETFRLNQLYRGAAQAFPDNTFGQYSTYLDRVQIYFYFLMGGGATPEEAGGNWLTQMRSNLSGLSGSLPNFRSYMAWGNAHCITDTADFYTMQVNGIRFRDWFADLIAGERPRTVNCSDCNTPEMYTPQ